MQYNGLIVFGELHAHISPDIPAVYGLVAQINVLAPEDPCHNATHYTVERVCLFVFFFFFEKKNKRNENKAGYLHKDHLWKLRKNGAALMMMMFKSIARERRWLCCCCGAQENGWSNNNK